MSFRHFLCALAVAGAMAIDANRSSAWADDLDDCNREHGERQIRGCTKVIDALSLINFFGAYDAELGWYYRVRGNAYSFDGKYDEALADLSEAIRHDPSGSLIPMMTSPYFVRGSLYETLGETDLAIADFGKAIELRPEETYAYSSRGAAYLRTGAYELAIADFDQVIALKPGGPSLQNSRLALLDAYTFRGDAYRALGDIDLALES